MRYRFSGNNTWRVAAVIVLAIAMGVAAVLPVTGTLFVAPGADKAVHVLAFFVLTVAGISVLGNVSLRLVCGIVAFGALLEVVQLHVPYHGFAVRDLVANVTGTLLAVGSVLLARKASCALRSRQISKGTKVAGGLSRGNAASDDEARKRR